MTIKPYTPVQLAEDAKNFPPVSSAHKPNLDKTFLRQLRAILRICFPSWHSKETLILVLHSFFLVARTVLSVGVARLDGRIVRDLVSADGKRVIDFLTSASRMTTSPSLKILLHSPCIERSIQTTCLLLSICKLSHWARLDLELSLRIITPKSSMPDAHDACDGIVDLVPKSQAL